MHKHMNEYIITPKDYKKDKSYILPLSSFGLVWAVGTVLIFLNLVLEGASVFLIVFFILGLIITFGVLYEILTINRPQKIIINKKIIHFTNTGLLPNSKVSFNQKSIKEITLGYYGEESNIILNVFTTKKPKRIILAKFVHPDNKTNIFKEIEEFFSKNNLTYTFTLL